MPLSRHCEKNSLPPTTERLQHPVFRANCDVRKWSNVAGLRVYGNVVTARRWGNLCVGRYGLVVCGIFTPKGKAPICSLSHPASLKLPPTQELPPTARLRRDKTPEKSKGFCVGARLGLRLRLRGQRGIVGRFATSQMLQLSMP